MDLCDVSYYNIDIGIDITRNFDQLDDIEKQGLQFEEHFDFCSACSCLLHLLLVSIEPPDTQQ